MSRPSNAANLPEPRDIRIWRLLRRYTVKGRVIVSRRFSSLLYSPNSNPTFLLGNQKSGTTAIAALLAAATGRTVTLDMRNLTAATEADLHSGAVTIRRFVKNNVRDFTSDIIKEPRLTFLYDSLRGAFPSARYVMIIRDPRTNIRSILNRLDLPGRPESCRTPLDDIPAEWQLVLRHPWINTHPGNYIENLAYRWARAVQIYLEHRERMLLVTYEEFIEGKTQFIATLAENLGMNVTVDVSSLVDKPYQPPGDHTTSLDQFFGRDNLRRIEDICAFGMDKLRYAAYDL